MGCISEAWPGLTPPCAIYQLRLPFDHLPVRKFKSSISRPEQCRLLSLSLVVVRESRLVQNVTRAETILILLTEQ